MFIDKFLKIDNGASRLTVARYLWPVIILLIVSIHTGFAQSLHVERRFTVKDGLPSNQVYTMLQDKQGFLWFATDNGVSRYDGKLFKNFGMEDGLPDRDIFDIIQEDDGTIWVSSYKGGIACFNAKENRFYLPEGGEVINLANAADFFHIKSFGTDVLISNAATGYSFVFRNKKLFSSDKTNRLWEYIQGGKLYRLYPSLITDAKGRRDCYVVYDNGSSRDSVLLTTGLAPVYGDIVYKLVGNTLYITRNTGKLYIVKAIHDQLQIDSVVLKSKQIYAAYYGNNITVTSAEGDIYLLDKKSLQVQSHTKLNEYSPYAYTDNNRNIWVATLGRGVIWLKKNYVDDLLEPPGIADQRFKVITVDDNQHIYAGNDFGDVVDIKGNEKKAFSPLPEKEKIFSRTRGIIKSAGKVFVFFEVGGYINYARPVLLKGGQRLRRIKSCVAINDSIIIVGTASTAGNGGLYALNTKTEVLESLATPVEWIASLTQLDGRYIYAGAADGLHKYDIKEKKYSDDFANTILRKERSLFVTSTRDNRVVVATVASGIYFVKEDKIIGHIPYKDISGHLPVCMVADSANGLWIGTKGGLVKLSYTLSNNKLSHQVINYAPLGSLLAAEINALYLKDSKLYLATGLGAGVFNTDTQLPFIDIKPILTGVKINQQSYPLSDSFIISTSQHAIELSFSGVDINGNLKMLQYSLDTAKGWVELPQNLLNLQLGSGEYNIWVRAINESGHISSDRLRLHFDVKYPLYRQWWFITLITALVVTFLFVIYNRIRGAAQRKKEKDRAKIEQERNRITADLHDEIGASLSSLQMYSDVAMQMLDKDKEKSRSMLHKIGIKAYRISGEIGDIIWSIRPPGEGSMTIGSRIKKTLHEMLTDSNIVFDLVVDESLDSKPRSFVFRKNIMLIVKEAVNNSIKYAKPERITVKLLVDTLDCVLVIEDDGNGFNLEYVTGKGNGLQIMKMRVEELGGHINITTQPGAGVKIVAVFPLKQIN